MSAALSIAGRGLKRTFRRSGFTLDVPHIEAPAGGTLALLGPSGSGKSTLLHVLGLLEQPDSGQVLLSDRPVSPSDQDARLSIAAVFQRPFLFKGSVGANVGYGLAVRGVPREQRRARIAAALERVGLGGYESRSAHSISGGEAQRVSLARALVIEPRVLLLDEPLASVDALLKRRLSHEFASILRDSDVTVVYVTHDQEEALVVADRIALMNQGRIVASGAAEEVTGLAEDEWTAAFFGVEPATETTVVQATEGLTHVRAGAVEIALPGELPVGTKVLVAVPPEDVLLFEGDVELPTTTARNRLDARVTAIEPRGSTLRVSLDACGMRLAASVSRAAASELALAPGSRVLAVFKATAVKWRCAEAVSDKLNDYAGDQPAGVDRRDTEEKDPRT